MKPLFADSFYFLAFVDRGDAYHGPVKEFAGRYRGPILTTRWILAEVANALGDTPIRPRVIALLQRVVSDPLHRIVLPSDNIFEEGWNLYLNRPDKEWSLTDCISFVVMEREGLREALTGDHHFTQAGFVALFSE